MPRQHVELIRWWERFWSVRDPRQLADVFDPEIVVDLSRNVFNPDVYRGYDGLERLLAGVDEMWEHFNAEIVELIEAGDRLVSSARLTGVGRGSGVETTMELFQIWDFRDGRIVRMTGGYRSRDEALEAAAQMSDVPD